MPREHLLNAEFDISLRPAWRGIRDRAPHVDALKLHYLMVGEPGDTVLLPEPLPDDFVAYLHGNGVEPPAITVEPELSRGSTFAPFGWNAGAAQRNLLYDRPTEHPPLDVVRQVNSRRFSASFEEELGEEGCVVGAFSSLPELEAALVAGPVPEHGWIVKSEFGNAGLGNRRLRGCRLGEGERRFIESLFEEEDWVLLERWRPRVLDLCTTFELGPEGDVHGLNVHEVVNTADGAFIGALFERGGGVVDSWREEAAGAAARVADCLTRHGYFGPVCIDSFVSRDGGVERLRPLVDLNARSHVSAPALRLWRQWQRSSTLYWRFFNARKLELPVEIAELVRLLGSQAFDPDRRCGVLLTSPLRRPGGRPMPKIGLCLMAPTRDEVLAMEQRFRGRFER